MGVMFTDNSDKCGKAIREAVLDGVRSFADQTESIAKGQVPVDTGRLRESIRAEVEDDGDSVSMALSANTDYATYVELGTRRMPARPYIRPAVIQHTDVAVACIATAVENALK